MNSMLINNIKKNIYLYILEIVVFLFCLLTCLIHHINIFLGLKLFLFQLFGLLLPGLIVENKFTKNSNSISKLAFSYFFGILVVLIEYVILMLLGISKYSYIVLIIQSIVLIYYFVKNKLYENIECNEKDWVYCLILVLFINIFCLLAVSLGNTYPTITNSTIYNKDFLYWVGNTLSFTKRNPVEDYRLVGYPFYYHYFSNVLLAQTSFFISGDVVDISLLFSSILPSVLLVLSSYTLLSKVIKKKLLIYIGMVLILFADSSSCFLTSHLYACSFGYDYGYAIGMLSISYLIDMFNNDTYFIKEMIVSCLLIATCTGFKGPVAVVALMGYAVVALYLICTKRIKQGFVSGIIWLISFLLIYILFVSATLCPYEIQGNSLELVGLFKGFDMNVGPINTYISIRDVLKLSDSSLLKIISIIYYIFKQNGFVFVTFIGMIIYLIYQIVKKQRLNIVMLVSISIFIWGWALTLITHQDGNSQMYFGMSVIPFGVFGGMHLIEKIHLNRIQKIVAVFVIVILTIPNVLNFINHEVIDKSRLGLSTYNGTRINNVDFSSTVNCYVTKEDYEVAKWLENNTIDSDLIAVDSFEYGAIKNYEVLGVFSKRFIWNDGKYTDYEYEANRRQEIVNDVISGNVSINVLIDEGVSYLVKTPYIANNYELDVNHSEIIYKDNGYVVYKLK